MKEEIMSGVIVCGGTRHLKITKEKPKDWFTNGYKMIVPYNLKWRPKLGKVECDCKEMLEIYQPYYGFTLYHSEECAAMKYLRKYPQMENFMWDYNPRVIAYSD